MDRSKRAVAGLPDDPLVEILSRIPAKSVCRFRCVSKAWCGLIDDPLNRRKLPQTLEGFFVVQKPRLGPAGSVVDGHFDFINFVARSVPLDVDRCFSFLTTRPEIECLFYEDSCNGLFLFQHYRKTKPSDTLGYIVCNPATKHWGTVPPCGCRSEREIPFAGDRETFFAFDPAISSHFHLIQFWKWSLDEEGTFENPLIWVHAYSSETGMWSHLDEQGHLEGWRHQSRVTSTVGLQQAFFNDMLHLIVSLDLFQTQKMVALDVRGKTKRMITIPAVAEGRCWYYNPYIGQSQGRLHYINHNIDALGFELMCDCEGSELSIWILQDYDTQEWVLKDIVSFLKLFGVMTASRDNFDIVAIHPDCNVVFFRQPFNRLIAYDMDRKEVSVVACLENKGYEIAPYIPYFSESPALADKH